MAALVSADCDKATFVASEPAAAAVVEAIRSAAAQRTCQRISAASQLIGDGTVAECAELVQRATASGDLAAVLPDEQLRNAMAAAASIERDVGERCVAAADPSVLGEGLNALAPTQAFYERLTALGVEVRPRGR